MATTEWLTTNTTNWNNNSDIIDIHDMISQAQTYVRFIVCLLIIPGNTLTILLVAKNRQMQKPSNVLVAALAVADLLVGVTGIMGPMVMATVGNCYAFLNTMTNVLSDWSIGASSAHLFLIGADRYVAIVYPLRYEVIVTVGLVKKLVAIAWLINQSSALSSFVWLFKNPDSCAPNVPPEQVLLFFVFYFGVTFFMVIIYTRIYLIARTHARRIQVVPTASSETRRVRKTTKTTNMFSYIMMAYFVAWTPYFVCALTDLLTPRHITAERITLEAIKVLALVLGLGNSGINFFIYAWTSKTFRRGYIELITCRKVNLSYD